MSRRVTFNTGGGAYRLKVSSRESDFYHRELVTDGSITLDLPEGRYQASLERLDNRRMKSEPVYFDAATERVDLHPETTSEQRESQSRRYKVPFETSMLRRSESIVQSPEFWSRFAESADAVQGQGIDIETIGEQLRSEISLRHYSVGVSRDEKIRKKGGWAPAADVAVEHEIDEEGALSLSFDTDRMRPHHRLRVTLAIEGKASIRVPVPLYRGGLEIRFAPTLALGGLDGVVSITPLSDRVAALTAIMDQLTESEADQLLQWNQIDHDDAVQAFAEKGGDPWTAAAAAVLLTRLRRLDGMASWAYRLADIAPYIADSPIVAAWACAAESDADTEAHERRILEHLVEARRRGAPSYYVSQALALDLLSVLATSAAAVPIRKYAKAEHRIWSRRGRARLHVGSYLVWEQLGQRLRKGTLASSYYTVIAQGQLGPEGFGT